MTFAVLKTGGKQYRVTSGDVLRVEKLAAEAGETVQFNDILMVGAKVGTPTIDGAAVQAEVIDQIKGEKTINFVRRRRKHSSKRTKGHRQQLTLLRVTEILEKGGDKTGVKAALGAASAGAMAAVAKGIEKKATKKAAPKADKAAEAKAAKATAAEGKGIEKKAKEPAKKAAPEAAAVESAGTRPANLLDGPRDGKPDDLKLISGVGPKLEGLLHSNGVYHFDQIAAWNADEIAYMDDQLSFKGRIERDNWLAQAADLMKES